jgi:hypothetical protein
MTKIAGSGSESGSGSISQRHGSADPDLGLSFKKFKLNCRLGRPESSLCMALLELDCLDWRSSLKKSCSFEKQKLDFF